MSRMPPLQRRKAPRCRPRIPQVGVREFCKPSLFNKNNINFFLHTIHPIPMGQHKPNAYSALHQGIASAATAAVPMANHRPHRTEARHTGTKAAQPRPTAANRIWPPQHAAMGSGYTGSGSALCRINFAHTEVFMIGSFAGLVVGGRPKAFIAAERQQPCTTGCCSLATCCRPARSSPDWSRKRSAGSEPPEGLRGSLQ